MLSIYENECFLQKHENSFVINIKKQNGGIFLGHQNDHGLTGLGQYDGILSNVSYHKIEK